MVSWTVVVAIGSAQAALLALALWRRPVNRVANRVLAVWIALIGLDLAVKAMYWSGPDNGPGAGLFKAYRLVGLFPFLYGSLFYLYIKALTGAKALGWRDSVHLAGFVIVAILHLGFFFHDLLPAASVFARYLSGPAETERLRFDIALYAYSLSYVIAGLVQVGRYRRGLRQQRSDADRMSLHWIDAMAISQIVIWSIATLHWLVKLPWVDYPLIYGAVTAWVFVVGYLSLSQGAVRVVERVPAPAQPEAIPAADDPRFPEIEARLSQLMTEHQLFREPALAIGQLAKRSGYPEYLVSAVINRRFGENFWEYINRLRIEAASGHLADAGDGRTILDIAYACGFTSKSTFNAAFKRQLGETPSAFRRHHARADAPASSNG